MMISFLTLHWDSVLTVIVVIGIMLYLLKKGATKQVYQMLFYLVAEAEREFGSGTGALKYSAVTLWLYESLPTIITMLFTSKQVDEMIEKAVKEMKAYLDSNSNARVLIVKK